MRPDFASQAATDLAARLRATRRWLRMPGKIQPIWLSQFENALTGSSYNLRFGDLNDEHDEPEVGKGSRIGSTLPRFSYARIIARKTRLRCENRVLRAMMRCLALHKAGEGERLSPCRSRAASVTNRRGTRSFRSQARLRAIGAISTPAGCPRGRIGRGAGRRRCGCACACAR